MRALPSSIAVLCSAVVMGACSCDPSGSPSPVPFRDAWRLAYEGPMALLDEDGTPLVTSLAIGSAEGHHENFANRGDVVVAFDGPPDTIRIEMRRFVLSHSQAEADDAFDRLQLWAFAGGEHDAPQRMDPEDRCGGDPDDPDAPARPWRDDCEILVYYDGQIQPVSAGADIRVTLPPDYRQRIDIATGDEVSDDSYQNRGDVCVDGLAGQLTVSLGSGIADVVVADDARPYPACPDDMVAQCEAWDDPGDNADAEVAEPGSNAWSRNCPCFAGGYTAGRVDVKSRKPSAADITVDLPATLWTTVRLDTAVGDRAAAHCEVAIGGLDELEHHPDPLAPWHDFGEANVPSGAPSGAGFSTVLSSAGCGPVATVDSPEAWIEDGDPPTPMRGTVELCSGCLRGSSCDDLLPGA